MRDPNGADEIVRRLIAHLTHGVLLLDADGTLREANDAALAALGASPTVVGLPIWDALAVNTPELRERLKVDVTAACRGVRVSYNHEFACDAGSRTLEIALAPMIESDGSIARVVAEMRDVTTDRNTAATLRESENRFQRIVSIAVDAILSIDAAQRITLFNHGAEVIFGYASAEVMGQPLNMLLPPELASLHGAEVRAFGQAPDSARRMGQRREILGRRKNGEIFNAEASISKTTVGGQTVFTAVLRDVTERWRAEQEKNALLAATEHARDVAERATKQRDEMLQVVSHDLRNPLSAIGMCVGPLRNADTPTAERLHHAETINESVELMHRLITDLLDIANIEAGTLGIRKQSCDPIMIIAKSLGVFELPAHEHGVSLRAVGVEHLPAINADAERLLQVLDNLIGNALKFTPAGGAITVGGSVRDNEVVFSVQDNGLGIAAEHLDQVFVRRWHSGQLGKHGLGLGLAIAHGIVAAHGGKIWVTSALGSGSVFEFSIPRVTRI